MSVIPTAKAYAKIVGPAWVHYMEKPVCIMGRGPASVDVALSGDASVSRKHVKIEFSPELQAFEISVVGKNGIFVNGEFLRNGEQPRVLRSHTDIIVGRTAPILLTFYLPKRDPGLGSSEDGDGDGDGDGEVETRRAGTPQCMVTVVGQQLVHAEDPLDADEIYKRVVAARNRICDRLGQPEAIKSSIRAAITMNPHIFETIPAYDLERLEETRTGRKPTPRAMAGFKVREEHRLRFLKLTAEANGAASAPPKTA